MQRFSASTVKRIQLRKKTLLLRKMLDMENSPYLDIVRIVERMVGDKFYIVTGEDLGNKHGLTNPETGEMYIREDVYAGACQGKGRDRFTIAHEFGHFLLHNGVTIGLARVREGTDVPAYKDPEWQASCFAGELLMPVHIIKGKTPQEVMAMCGVSYDAAVYQLGKI